MKMLPEESTTTPEGDENRAEVPVLPLVLPDTPLLPAKVVTTAALVILRTVWPATSVT